MNNMTTDKTIIFASLFNQVSRYFYEIAPKRKGKEEVEYQDEAGLWQRELKDYFYIDKYAEVINITKCPISQEVFLETYADFKSEFHKYAFLYSGDLIRNILGGSFDIKDTPTQKQLLKANLIEETVLLNCYIEAQKFINDILYAGVPWLEDEPDGITIYRKNNSKKNNQNQNDPDYEKSGVESDNNNVNQITKDIILSLGESNVTIAPQKEMENLLRSGRTINEKIDITGSYASFYNTLKNYIPLIPKKYYKEAKPYKLIQENFTRNKKDIPLNTISNSLNSENW